MDPPRNPWRGSGDSGGPSRNAPKRRRTSISDSSVTVNPLEEAKSPDARALLGQPTVQDALLFQAASNNDALRQQLLGSAAQRPILPPAGTLVASLQEQLLRQRSLEQQLEQARARELLAQNVRSREQLILRLQQEREQQQLIDDLLQRSRSGGISGLDRLLASDSRAQLGSNLLDTTMNSPETIRLFQQNTTMDGPLRDSLATRLLLAGQQARFPAVADASTSATSSVARLPSSSQQALQSSSSLPGTDQAHIHTPLLDSFVQHQQNETSLRQPRPPLQSPVAARLPPKQGDSPSKGIPLALDADAQQLSGYQQLVRQSLEFFTSSPEDVLTNVQGRRKKVLLGQVGIRCRYCSDLPIQIRGRGSVYYPQRLTGVYQAAQNMASTHLMDSCMSVPTDLRREMETKRQWQRRDAAPGGKAYWVDACKSMGLVEDDSGIWFSSQKKPPPAK